MFKLISDWYKRNFADPRAAMLAITIVAIGLVLYFFMGLVAPIFVAIILAYLLDLVISFLHNKLKINRILSILIVFGLFLFFLIFIIGFVIPGLVNQIIKLSSELPYLVNEVKIKNYIADLKNYYPNLVNEENILYVIDTFKTKIIEFSNFLIPYLVNSLSSVVKFSIYVFLVPLMSLFMVKDKKLIINSIKELFPNNLGLVSELNNVMQVNIKNYIIGKIFECVIITVITYIELSYFNLNFALLLSVLVGITVFIPYVGVIVAVVPVFCVAISQFGLNSTFYYLMVIFIITQILDGNVLVPFLFSEAVSLHPLVILISVLIFGGLLGFWGVFFAIPLASLVKSIIEIWPRSQNSITQQ